MELGVTASPPDPAADTSLAEHEAQFSNRPTLVQRDAPPSQADRDEQGKFKQRAESQKAKSTDADRIAALTKEYHDAEREIGIDLTQEDGESNRVFELRRRAELAKAYAKAKKSPPAAPAAAPSPQADPGSRPSVPNGADSGISLPADFPKEPNPDDFPNDYNDYVRAHSRWAAKAEVTLERLQRAKVDDERAFFSGVNQRFASASERYPDFKAVVLDAPTSPIPHNSHIERWTLKSKLGPDVVYHAFKDPSIIQPILVLTDRDEQTEALTLLGQRLTASPPRSAAASTRSPAALVVPPVVKPPNLVRSGPMHADDEPPNPETSSLADHERHYWKSGRR